MAGLDNCIAWGSPLNNDREVIGNVDWKRRGDVKSGGVCRERSDDDSVRHSKTWRLALLHNLNVNWGGGDATLGERYRRLSLIQ